MKKTNILIAALCVSLCAAAQNPIAMSFAAYSMDARSAAMGGTSAASWNLAWSAMNNPAAAVFDSRSYAAGVSALNWQPSGNGEFFGAAGAGIKIGDRLGVSLAGAYGLSQEYNAFDEFGRPQGSFKPTDLNMAAGVSCRILDWLSAGVSAHILNQALSAEDRYQAFAADAMLAASFGEVQASAGVTSIGTKVQSLSGNGFQLPAALSASAAWSHELAANHKAGAAVDMRYYLAGIANIGIGAEYTWNSMVSVRGGYHLGNGTFIPSYASLGAGVNFKGITLDAAYLLASEALANTFAITLGAAF